MSQTDRPLVSVIMPLFNKRTYVRRAIESVQKQTFRNWELIIIDDGSTDGSLKEIPKSNKRIRLCQQRNAGPSNARNNGVKKAQGKFVTFLDADDYYYPDKLEQEMGYLNDRESVEWMFSAGNFERKEGIQTGVIYKTNNKPIPEQPQIYQRAIDQLRISNWPIDGLCIRRSLFKQLSGFREDMRCYEITEFFYRCALLRPKVFILPKPVYSVVSIPASTSKILVNRTEGLKLLGKSLFTMANKYSSYSNHLEKLAQNVTLTYIGSLIITGKKVKAREALLKDYPYRKNGRWLKMRLASILPDWISREVAGRKILKEFV